MSESKSQPYFLNPTLFNYQLIELSRYEIFPIPKELEANKDITVKIRDKDNEKTFPGCHIDNTRNRRLRLPLEVMIWIKKEFPFSAAYFTNEKAISTWKKNDVKKFFSTLKKGEKLDYPAETLELLWIAGEQPYLRLQPGFKITEQNAAEVLSTKALATVLPYIFSNVRNTSYIASSIASRTDSKKCNIIDDATPWISTAEKFSHPGIYILRRKENGQYFYYIGKSTDISNRVLVDKNKNVFFHPKEKGEENKQYNAICCISINMDDIKELYITLGASMRTPKNNPRVAVGSEVDNALYAIENLAIHIASMILKGEGKKLDNKQFFPYTSEALLS